MINYRKRKNAITLFVTLLFVLGMLTGCASSSGGYPQTAAGEASSAGEYYDGESADAAAGEDWDFESESLEQISGSTNVSVSGGASSQRKIITTVDLYMESVEYDQTATGIYAAIEAVNGYIEYSDITGNIDFSGGTQSAAFPSEALEPSFLTAGARVQTTSANEAYTTSRRRMFLKIRVPQTDVAGFVSRIEPLGNVVSKQESAKDVTLEYVDIESHKRALEAEQERLLSMLEQAETVEDMILLENRLSEVRYKLESYESQLRVYDDQVSYATVNLTLDEVIVYTEPPVEPTLDPTVLQRISTGLNRTFTGIARFWTDLFVWFVVNLIYIVCILIAVFVLYKLIKKRLVPMARKRVEEAQMRWSEEENRRAEAASEIPPTDNGEEVKKKIIPNDNISPKYNSWLRRFWRGLTTPPYNRLTMLTKLFTILHIWMALGGIMIEFTNGFYLSAPGQILVMLIGLPAALLFFLSFITIPLNIAGLIARQIFQPRKAYVTVLLILLQLFLAFLGWNFWTYLMF